MFHSLHYLSSRYSASKTKLCQDFRIQKPASPKRFVTTPILLFQHCPLICLDPSCFNAYLPVNSEIINLHLNKTERINLNKVERINLNKSFTFHVKFNPLAWHHKLHSLFSCSFLSMSFLDMFQRIPGGMI